LDEKRGFLFAACDEGSLRVINRDTGKILCTASSGDGVDIIAYSPKSDRIYLPGGGSATMAIVSISAVGSATVLTTVKTAKGAHCATTDDRGGIYVCDPSDGQLLVFKDVPQEFAPPDQSRRTGDSNERRGIRSRHRGQAEPRYMIVSDAGPVIIFACIGRLSLLHDVTGSLLIPDAIYDEIVVKQGGMPGAADVAQAAWVQKVSVANRAS
jgi:hypothetical protein